MKKLLLVASVSAFIGGIMLVIGGIWGIAFTYKNVAQENIITPADASIPNTPVRGPLTLKAQADIIRAHTLETTGGKTYAEMPRQIEKLDSLGVPILDENGKQIMVPNTARDMWVTATTLTTALNLGIMAYAFSGLVFVLGLISILAGVLCYVLNRRY
jgi:hypothetical protein